MVDAAVSGVTVTYKTYEMIGIGSCLLPAVDELIEIRDVLCWVWQNNSCLFPGYALEKACAEVRTTFFVTLTVAIQFKCPPMIIDFVPHCEMPSFFGIGVTCLERIA